MIDIEAALGALTLEQKCRLLAGETNWRTRADPEAGIPQVKMSDGPTGLRGEGHGDSGTPGVAVPAGVTLGASWDPALLADIGDLLGTEARRKRAHVLLGPTINLHRTPVGGRTFECYSEDPELTGALATRYVRAVQRHDVAVAVKHFVCNDTEVDRMRVDVEVDERALRELYLRPFERTVKEGGAWGIMAAYNRLHGEHCAHNRRLLTDILRDEELLPLYRKAGLVHVSLGTEAAAQIKLDQFNKETKVEDNRRAIELLRNADIFVEAQFIVGLDNETPETLEQTYRMAWDWQPDLANWAMYTPWPFTPLFQELGDKVEVFDFSKYNFVTPIMKPADVCSWSAAEWRDERTALGSAAPSPLPPRFAAALTRPGLAAMLAAHSSAGRVTPPSPYSQPPPGVVACQPGRRPAEADSCTLP